MRIGYTVAKSPLGKVLVAATERGVSAVYLGDAESALIAELREEYPGRKLRRPAIPTRNGCGKLCSGPKVRSRGWNFRSTCRRRRFSGASGRSCSGFPGDGRATTRRLARSLGRPKAVRAVARLARRIRFRSWCRATAVIRETARLPVIAGAFRAKEHCSKKERRAAE